MRRSALAIGSVVLLGAASVTTLNIAADRPATSSPQTSPRDAAGLLGSLPLSFIQNVGQSPDWVQYSLHGAETPVAFARRGLLLSMSQGDERWGVGVRFVGATPTPPVARAESPGVVSYFRGDPSDWATGLSTYSRLVYRDLWPGIDLVYAGVGHRLKYSFRVAPGADPADIRLGWRGARDLWLDDDGRLQVDTPAGTVVDDAPFTYQVVDGARIEVPSAYDLAGPTGTGFEVGAYDADRPLVIDPATFVYAGYIGGEDGAGANDVAVDASGAAYVVGSTTSSNTTFPDGDGFGGLSGPDNGYNGGFSDAFVAKVDPSGTSLVYAGYIGGTDSDQAYGVAVDGSGAAYVAGETGSDESSFPVITGPDVTDNGNGDAFVAKVNSDGASLDYAGYVGGSSIEEVGGVAVDPSGAAYVIGDTNSTQADFPDGTDDGADGSAFDGIPGVDQIQNGGEDVFAVKVSAAGAFAYATFIGGNTFDRGEAIAVDPSGAAYLTGETASTDTTFPDGDGFGTLTGPDTSHELGFDAHIVKLDPAGTSFVFAGYVGGSEGDVGLGVAVDASGAAYLAGITRSDQTSFPVLGGPDLTFNGGTGDPGDPKDAFVAKVVGSGASLAYAGYVGGSQNDEGLAIAVDGSGSALISGETPSDQATFPDGDGFGSLTGPDTTFNGGSGEGTPSDAFVASVVPSGAALNFAGYIGGSQNEEGRGIAVDGSGAAYVVGATGSDQSTFPDGDGFGSLPGFDTTYNGVGSSEADAFVVKIAEPSLLPATCRGKQATVTGTEAADALSGTGGPDVIAALGGDDTVFGLGGNDMICTGAGNDSAKGGGGNDQILGESGNDKLTGNGGKDKLKGGPGKDRLKGSGGNDRLTGGGGRDTCAGGGGTDRAGCEKEKSTP